MKKHFEDFVTRNVLEKKYMGLRLGCLTCDTCKDWDKRSKWGRQEDARQRRIGCVFAFIPLCLVHIWSEVDLWKPLNEWAVGLSG